MNEPVQMSPRQRYDKLMRLHDMIKFDMLGQEGEYRWLCEQRLAVVVSEIKEFVKHNEREIWPLKSMNVSKR